MSLSKQASRPALRLESLPNHLLLEVLRRVPEDREVHFDLHGDDSKIKDLVITSRGAVEQVSRAFRLLCHSLPAARIAFEWESDLKGTVGSGFAGRVLAALGGRPVRRVEFINAPDTLPPQFWTELGQGLAVQAHSLVTIWDSCTGWLAPGVLKMLQRHCQSLQELWIDSESDRDRGDSKLSAKLSTAFRHMQALRFVCVNSIQLTPELAEALAGLPHLQSVEWGGIDLPAEDSSVWRHLAQLGTCLDALDVCIETHSLPLGPNGRQLPSSLQALTGLGRLEAKLCVIDNAFGGSLPGLDSLPLHSMITFDGAPPEVWTCPMLERLLMRVDGGRIPLPSPDTPASQLSPLLELDIDFWDHSGGTFPPVLCQLSGLTSLSLDHCSLAAHGALPPEFSQLRNLEHLTISEVVLDSASMALIAPLAALTYLSLNTCGLTFLPVGPYLEQLSVLCVTHNPFQPQQMPLPAAVALATELQTLWFAMDADQDRLKEQWPQVEGVLQHLPFLKDLSVSFLDETRDLTPTGHVLNWNAAPPSHAAAKALLAQLVGSSGLTCTLR